MTIQAISITGLGYVPTQRIGQRAGAGDALVHPAEIKNEIQSLSASKFDSLLSTLPASCRAPRRPAPSFTYIDDIVEGVIRTLDRVPSANPLWNGDAPDPASSNAPYRLYNIGNQQPVELLRYIEVLEQCLGRKAQMQLLPLPLQAGDVPDTEADVSELIAAVGYRPRVSVEDGVANFVQWYKNFYVREGAAERSHS